jgi:hypothetical protein
MPEMCISTRNITVAGRTVPIDLLRSRRARRMSIQTGASVPYLRQALKLRIVQRGVGVEGIEKGDCVQKLRAPAIPPRWGGWRP